MCVCTVQCWPKPSTLCPGSVMSSMWSLRKMGWAALINCLIQQHFLLTCSFLLVHCLRRWLVMICFFSLVAGSAVCELLSVGICLLPVRTTLLQQVQTVCVCVCERVNTFMSVVKRSFKPPISCAGIPSPLGSPSAARWQLRCGVRKRWAYFHEMLLVTNSVIPTLLLYDIHLIKALTDERCLVILA